jgi:hypothetical protein
MKRTISLALAIIAIVLSTLSINAYAANIDVAEEGYRYPKVSFDYTYYGYYNKYDSATKPNSFIDMTIYTQSNIPKYRYYYKLVDCYGNSTDWVRAGEIKRNGRGAITVEVDISYKDINNISTRGFWSCNKVCTWESGSNVRIYLTARGLNGHNEFVTDFYRNVYFEESTWAFCPATVASWQSQTLKGRTVSVYLPIYSFANRWTEGIRVYYWSKSSGSWKRLHDFKRYAWGYYPDGGICCGNYQVNDWSIINDMYVDGDGDIKLTARVIDRNGYPISPYYNQYWNFNRFIYPW